jgi:N-carbamoyl-L-amino-acid hydrolase
VRLEHSRVVPGSRGQSRYAGQAAAEAVREPRVEAHRGRERLLGRVTAESLSAEVAFDTSLAARIAGLLGGAPILPTGAGHDAGVLSAHVPTAMLFVRNPTGISHSPAEYASPEDCAAGVEALATVLRDLT